MPCWADAVSMSAKMRAAPVPASSQTRARHRSRRRRDGASDLEGALRRLTVVGLVDAKIAPIEHEAVHLLDDGLHL